MGLGWGPGAEQRGGAGQEETTAGFAACIEGEIRKAEQENPLLPSWTANLCNGPM